MKLNKFFITALGTTLFCFPSFTLAQSPYVQEIISQLQQADNFFVSNGFGRTHEPTGGQIGNNGYENITVNLSEGVYYMIVAVCDNDCSNLDLFLYDENNNLIDSDNAVDSTPIVEVNPEWTGQFIIQVKMVSCSNVPCDYAAVVYGQ